MSADGDDTRQLRKALKRAEMAAAKLGANDKTARRAAATSVQLRRQFGSELSQAALATVAVMVGTFLFGDFIGLGTSALLFIGLIGGAFIVDRVGGFSVPFGISVFVVIFALASFLPNWATEPFMIVAVTFESITGWPVRRFTDPVQLAVVAVGVILLIWFVDIRFTSGLRRSSGQPEAKKPGPVARAMQDRAEDFVEAWLEVIVVVLFFGFALAQLLANAGADLGANIFAELAEVPVISAALGSDFVGYLALGGTIPVLDDLPIVGDILGLFAGIGPVGFIGIALFVLALAVFQRRNQ